MEYIIFETETNLRFLTITNIPDHGPVCHAKEFELIEALKNIQQRIT